MAATKTHYRTCNLCEAMCGIEIQVQDDKIIAIRGDKADPFSRGHICPKAVALQDIHTDPDRLRQPVRRTPTGWERVTWDEALAETAQQLRAVQQARGRDAVAIYLGNPTVHNYAAAIFAQVFSRALRTRNRFSATSVDQLPHQFVAYFMYGHQLLIPIPDLDRTSFLLILGANPVVSNGSLMSAPDVTNRIKAIRARGGRVVVVDPRRTETAEVADTHLFIRPGADALLLLAMLNIIVTEGLTTGGPWRELTDGWEQLPGIVAPFTPERVAPAVGIPAATIRTLARDFAGAPTAVCYARVGASTQAFGALAQWLVQVLNIVTGNLDCPGGTLFTRPAIDLLSRTSRGHFAKGHTRARGLPEFGGEYPVAALAEEILTPGEGQIRALVTAAGNPVLSSPNGRQLDRALAGLDFMVAVDFYINETTRHAHLILPPTAALEHDHYDLIFHALAIRNTAKYSPALFNPAPDTRHEWEIFLDLATRLGARGLPGRLRGLVTRRALDILGPAAILDAGLRVGPYGSRWNVLGGGLSLRKLKRNPHGVDLGPLEPSLPDRLHTKNRRIQLTPPVLVGDLDRLERRFFAPDAPATDPDHLALIGRRQLRSNNSWMHNSERLVKGPARCTLLIHPEDALRRGLVDGALARVQTRVGSVDIPVEVSDAIMPGVVSIPHGWGHDRPGVRLGVAQAHAGVSLNDLTDDQALDALCGVAAFSGVPAAVTAVHAVEGVVAPV